MNNFVLKVALVIAYFVNQSYCVWVNYYNGMQNPVNIFCTQSHCIYGFKTFAGNAATYKNCTNPPFIAIILDNTQMTVNQGYQTMTPSSPNAYKLIMFDVYFTSIWTNDILNFEYNGITYQFQYSTQNPLIYSTGFCDALQYEVITYNVTLPYTSGGTYLKFSILNQNVQAMIKNVHVAYQSCLPGCQQCTGPNSNQCTQCSNNVPNINGQCVCPIRQSFVSPFGCVDKCSLIKGLMGFKLRHKNKICVDYGPGGSNFIFYPLNLGILASWNIIYDPFHLDATDKKVAPYNFGVFRFREGTYTLINWLHHIYPLVTQVNLILCNSTPPNSGISFYVNSTYQGSMYFDGTNFIYDNLVLRGFSVYPAYGNCLNNHLVSIESFNYVKDSKFTFQIQGNFTYQNFYPHIDSLEQGGAWYKFQQQQDTALICVCNVILNLIVLNVNKVIKKYLMELVNNICGGVLQKLNIMEHIVQQLEKEQNVLVYCILDSRFIVKEFYDFTVTDTLNTTFILESQTAMDFFKGENVFWSYTDTKRIFGGKFVWAQARFSKTYTLDPHHSLTIYFTVVFGPNFPTTTTNYLGYTINNENEVMVTKSSNLQVIHEVSAYLPTLSIVVQCYGSDNNVINSYCGLSNYYIVVHYCKSFCLSCTDQFTCNQMDIYDTNVIKLDQSECLSNQFLDTMTYSCQTCPSECLTCFNEYECFTCQLNYQLIVTTCILNCNINQYFDGSQCLDCRYSCKQCKNIDYCIHCESTDLRYLENGLCLCYDNYYDEIGTAQCKACDKLCTKCDGQTNQHCQECIEQDLIELIGTVCDCTSGYYFDDQLFQCKECNSVCNKCFNSSVTSCLDCFDYQVRVLFGFECKCALGYYYQNDPICVQCPTVIDNTLTECFKICGDSSVIWYDQTCNPFTCLSGYENDSNQCISICGDGIITSDEECDDENNVQYDGCYNCRFQCPRQCITCDSSTILPCLDICGDSIISGYEECDDGNSIQFDGCFQCKKECQIQCTNCNKGVCYGCLTFGWVLNPVTLQCVENCGDGYIIGKEECDDGYNFNQNDSCYQCKFICRDDCLTCRADRKVCLECKIPGFKPIAFYCKNICGDGYLAVDPFNRYFEQCDDFNLTPNDGCSGLCQFECQLPDICTSCVNNLCQSCISTYYLDTRKNKCLELCNDNIIIGNEKCEDMNTSINDGCYNCQLSCEPSCQNCTINGCSLCQSGYQLIQNACLPICGDLKVVFGEDCEDGNLEAFDGCHQCRYSCQPECLVCYQGQCLGCKGNAKFLNGECIISYPRDLIFKQDLSQLLVIKNCKLMVRGKCLQCNKNYYMDLAYSSCTSLCGDGYVNGEEECEDNNNQMYDGCFNCKFQCNIECVECKFGRCIQCIEGMIVVPIHNQCAIRQDCSDQGYYYDQKINSCYDICGDGIVSPREECDDGNDIEFDGCYKCQYSCESFCDKCLQGYCYHEPKQCEYGLYYNFDTLSCSSLCGDGIIVFPDEECDDGNEIQDDQCNDCKLQCGQNCLTCLKQNICSACKEGYELIDSQCVESQNNCSMQNCQICLQFTCQKCFSGFSLLDNSCESVCGDGILVGSEKCDDGNTVNGDGCDSDCQPSLNSLCREQECVLVIPPKAQLIYKNEINNIQNVELIFDQQMKLSEGWKEVDFLDMIEAEILNESRDIAIITLNCISNITNELSNIKVDITITFNQIVNVPKLRVTFLDEIGLINEEGISIIEKALMLTLKSPNTLSASQQEKVDSLIQMSQYNLKLVAIIIGLSSLTGQSQIVQNLLDVIQQLYYLKYLNTRIGYNLQQFFQTFSIIQLSSIYDAININPPNSDLIIFQYQPSQPVYEFDNRSANFISNLFSLSLIFLVFAISYNSLKYINKKIMWQINRTSVKGQNLIQLQIVNTIARQCVKVEKMNCSQQFKGILFSMIYEYGISTFLTLKYSPNSTIQELFGATLSAICLLFFSIFLIAQLGNPRQRFLFSNQKESLKYVYICLQRLLFTIFLIFFFNSPVIQICFCWINEFHYCYLLYANTIYEVPSENFKQIFSHLVQFFLFTLYLINDFYKNDSEKLIEIGWIIIGSMSGVLAMTLITDVYLVFQPLVQKCIQVNSPKERMQANHTLNHIDCTEIQRKTIW